jgi:predicted lysophospholipase L1 biosynthesis ABC-type transport system permease subunit
LYPEVNPKLIQLRRTFDQMSQKKSFTDVFQDTFGTTWNDAKPEIARVIYDRYLNNY